MNSLFSFACSVIGKTHIDKGTVLQDASVHYDNNRVAVAIVSDGHGSENFPRSDIGSKIACDTSLQAILDFLDNLDASDLEDPYGREQIIIQLCKNILLRWSEEVVKDAIENPFTEDEVRGVSERYRDAYLAGEKVIHAYGATLIIAIVTDSFFLAIRNGDGSCICVDENCIFEDPIPENEKNEASFTTSLCDADAINDFRYFYSQTLPMAVFLSSDGIENSYQGSEALKSLYRNICRYAAQYGGKATEDEVRRTLSEITLRGSGDDVSIAGILDVDLLKNNSESLERDAEKRRAQLLREKIDRQRHMIENMIDVKQSQLKRKIELRDKMENRLKKLEEDHVSIISEMKKLASNQLRAEQEKKKIKDDLPEVIEEVEKLSEEVKSLVDRLGDLLNIPEHTINTEDTDMGDEGETSTEQCDDMSKASHVEGDRQESDEEMIQNDREGSVLPEDDSVKDIDDLFNIPE